MTICRAVLVALLASAAYSQTVPRPLAVTDVYNITSATQVIDNRSINKSCNVYTFLASGSGTWSVQMQYADAASTGPWSSFGNTAVVTNTDNPSVGVGYGYHNWIRFNTTVGTTSVNYSCEKDFWIPSGSSGVSCPNCFQGGPFLGFASQSGQTPDAGITRTGANAIALGNGTQGDATAAVTAGSFIGDGTNLTDLLFPATTAVTLGKLITDMGVHALTCGVSPLLADNLSALQCALANATSTGNGQVFLPAGTYKISNTLDIPNKVRLLGVGRGDPGTLGSGGINTVIQAGAAFPANGAPLVRIGSNVNNDAHFGSGVESMTIDCNAIARTGLQELFGEEQTRNRHLLILNCPAFGYQIMGADFPSTGASQNSGPDEDIEIIPGGSATATTVDLDIENGQDLRPMTGISLVNGNASSTPTYCAKISGNNTEISSLHMEFCGANGGAGILIGGPGTQGMQGLVLNNADLTTGGQGPVAEIYNNQVNAPKGILILGARGGTYSVKNDISGEQSSSFFYAAGNGSNGDLPTLSLGEGDIWNNFNFLSQKNQIQVFTTSCPQFEIKYAGGIFPGFPICVNSLGEMDLGMEGTHSAGNLKFTNPYSVFGLSASPSINALTLQGAAADTGNIITSMIGDDLYWNHNAHQYLVTGNTSGTVNAVRFLNGGGIDFLSQAGVTENANYTESQVDGWRRMFISTSGFDIPLQNTPTAIPATGFLRFYAKNNGLCSMTSSFVETCYGTGGGGGTNVVLSNIVAATATNTINNANFPQNWLWNLTSNNSSGFTFGEASASTATGSNLFNVKTLAGSLLNPVTFTAQGSSNGVTMDTTGNLKPIGTGNITASTTTLNVNTSSPLSGGGALNANMTIGCPSCVFSNSPSLPVNSVVIGAGTLGISSIAVDAATTHSLFSGGSSSPPVFRAIASGDLPTALVYNSQANTYTLGLQDLSATTMKLPISAGAAPVTAGLIQYDSSTNNIFFGNGSQTDKIGWFTGSAPSSGDCVKWGANGQLQDFGSACGGSGASVALSNVTAAVTSNTIANGDSDQVWQWHQTTNATSGMTFTEDTASTATTSNLINIKTLATSTLNPLLVTANGTSNGVKVDTTGLLQAIGTGGVKATTTTLTVNTTSPITGGAALTSDLTVACATCVTSASPLTSNAVMIGGSNQASSTVPADSTTTHALFATAGAPAFRALATTDLPAVTLLSNQANTISTGLQDLSAATLKVPSSAAYAPTTAALFGYDSTNNWIVWGNGSQANKTGFWTGSTPTSGNCVKWGANGVLQDFGSTCGGSGASVALSNVTAAASSNTINNANFPQIWKWALTTNSTSGMTLTENSASTATTSSLFNVNTLASSTLNPVTITSRGTANGVQMSTAGVLAPIGAGGITANSTTLNVNTTGPLEGGAALDADLTLACSTCVTSSSSLTTNGVVVGSSGPQGVATILSDTNSGHVLFASGGQPLFRSIGPGDLPASLVYNNTNTVYTSTFQDFSAATMKVPMTASAAPTIAGLLQYDTVSNDLLFGNGGQTDHLTWFAGTPPTSGNCVKWGLNGELQDVGIACGSGGGGGSITINGVTGTTFNLPTATSGNGNTIVQTGTGPTATIQTNRTDVFRSVTTNSDSMTGTDCGNTIYVTTAGAVTETLPQPTLAGTYLGCPVTIDAQRAGGAVTVTPSNSSINGQSAGVSFTMNPSTSSIRKCQFKAVDGTNWRAYCYDDSGASGGGGGGGTTVTVGTYGNLPATCTTGQIYTITSGGYDYAVCTATNVWTTYASGTALTVPNSLGLSSDSYSAGNQLPITQGFETVQITGNGGGGGIAGTYRYWTAPAAPYTKYLYFNMPLFTDVGNYRLWSAGFQDSTSARHDLVCGVGAGATFGFWCRIRDINSSNAVVREDLTTTLLPIPISGPAIIALQDDGTNLHWSVCTRVGACSQIFAVGRTSFLTAPTRLDYGFSNTGSSNPGAISLDFLGVN